MEEYNVVRYIPDQILTLKVYGVRKIDPEYVYRMIIINETMNFTHRWVNLARLFLFKIIFLHVKNNMNGFRQMYHFQQKRYEDFKIRDLLSKSSLRKNPLLAFETKTAIFRS